MYSTRIIGTRTGANEREGIIILYYIMYFLPPSIILLCIRAYKDRPGRCFAQTASPRINHRNNKGVNVCAVSIDIPQRGAKGNNQCT